MGLNVSTTRQSFQTKLKTNLEQQFGSSANTNCNIKINPILKNTYGCSFKVINQCNANTNISGNMAAQLIADAINKLTQEQKAELLGGMNISANSTDIVQDIETHLSQKCDANSKLKLDIDAGKVEVENCFNTPIEFINTGDSTASCMMEAAARAAADIDNKNDNIQKMVGLFGGPFNAIATSVGSSAFIIICCCFLCVVCLIFIFGKTNNNTTPTPQYQY